MPAKSPQPDAPDTATRYWDSISSAVADGPQNAVWRRHSDTVNALLLRRWLRGEGYATLLKTDLFDESVGTGLCALLANYCVELHGIDISGVCVNAASERYPTLQAKTADVRELPYPDGFFDCIVSNSTLDHFPKQEDIETSLAELYRVSRPGATFVITLDNLQNPVVWLRSILPYQWLHRVGLLPYYVGATATVRGLRRMLIKAGFEVNESAAILHCPRVAAIPLSRWVQTRCSERGWQRWLKVLAAFEQLGRTPLRYLTGHFVAVQATKPQRTPESVGVTIVRA